MLARRPTLTAPARESAWDLWVGAKKRASDRTKKLTKKKDEPLRRGLTKKAPYKWARHVGKLVRGYRGRPVTGEGSGLTVASRRRPWRESDRVIGASRLGNAGGAKDPDFWCAFEDGEVKVIGDEPRNT
jgi:hypothetical protein